jgi:Flp pilus assembly pilin Flp
MYRVAPFFIPPALYALYRSIQGVSLLAQNPAGFSFPNLPLFGQVAVKLSHYVEGQALLIVPIPAFPSTSWAFTYVVLLSSFLWVTWMRRGRPGHWQLLGDLAACTAIMMMPAAVTSSLRIFYVPSAAFALTVVCGAMNYLGAARLQYKVLAACIAVCILILLYAMGRRISKNFSPQADTVRAELCAKLRATEETGARDKTVTDRLNQMCDRTDCCGPMRAGGPKEIYLNRYYEGRTEWVRQVLKH